MSFLELTRGCLLFSLFGSEDREQSSDNPRFVPRRWSDRQQSAPLWNKNWYLDNPDVFQLRLCCQICLLSQSKDWHENSLSRGWPWKRTFLEVPSTFLMIGVRSDFTRTNKAVPTSFTNSEKSLNSMVKNYLFTPEKNIVAFFVGTTIESLHDLVFPYAPAL